MSGRAGEPWAFALADRVDMDRVQPGIFMLSPQRCDHDFTPYHWDVGARNGRLQMSQNKTKQDNTDILTTTIVKPKPEGKPHS